MIFIVLGYHGEVREVFTTRKKMLKAMSKETGWTYVTRQIR